MRQRPRRRMRDSGTRPGPSGKEERRRGEIPQLRKGETEHGPGRGRCPFVPVPAGRRWLSAGLPTSARREPRPLSRAAASALVCRAASSAVDKQLGHVGPTKMFTLSSNGRPEFWAMTRIGVRLAALHEPRDVARIQNPDDTAASLSVTSHPLFTARADSTRPARNLADPASFPRRWHVLKRWAAWPQGTHGWGGRHRCCRCWRWQSRGCCSFEERIGSRAMMSAQRRDR